METLDPTSAAHLPTLGPYRLLRPLARGWASTWWQAQDTDSQRELQLLVWQRLPLPGLSNQVWRAACGPLMALRHPNLVTVLDASIEQGQPVLVIEAVQGVSLAQWLAEQEAMAPRQAVLTVIGMLDGLAFAHAAGVVHGRLEPSCVILDAAGRPRVSDFSVLPVPVDLQQLPTASGLYLSPEVVQGGAPDTAADIFCAGLVLYELLAGRPAVQDPNPQRARARLLEEDLTLPADVARGEHGEAQLRSILAHCLAREPAQRYAGAAQLREALQEWLTPALLEGEADSRGGQTLNRLMQQMMQQPDLPVQAEVVRRVRRLAGAEKVNLDEISRAVLDDVSLTQKLLRMTNAAYFSSVGGGSITTVSRAVALMGFMAIRDLAGTLPTLEDMRDRARAEALREEYERGRLAGRYAARLCPTQAEEEESFITALLQNLGRTLVRFYLPDEAAQIRQLSHSQGGSEASAVLSVLGLSFEDLGVSVARSWGLPEALVRGMRRPAADHTPRRPEKRDDWFRLLAGLGNELADVQTRVDRREHALRQTAVIDRYTKALGVTGSEIWAVIDAFQPPAPPKAAAGVAGAAQPAPAIPAEQAHPLSRARARVRVAVAHTRETELLLKIAGEAVFDTFQCQHVVVALREPGTETFALRLAFGVRQGVLRQHFRFRLDDEGDLFSTLCRNGADTLIRDAASPRIASRLPAWFHRHIRASSLMLLPLVQGDRPVGLLYADKVQVDGFRLADRELALLRGLRDELQLALPDSVAATAPLRAALKPGNS
ncbi:serine/threonine protein kinase [Caldimonas brevitalea]|uniref:Signal transduction protein n=1 Tax=Caldimonas brevitalea TaxID=413882 RepID=A0A0G3BQV0_9BURK|nr:serine/threonine protein kinase [Caldimonas brevitalea]AKJ28930.1 signal transduction protein [Caldimonas brevitalea]